jgi:UDP-N-acetylglucosamine diphosphorylase/glucosamine-1-phosphate N-acetyltransferase
MNYILYDGPQRDYLLPFTFTRPVSDIRIGIDTIREKWESFLGQQVSNLTEGYLQKKYPTFKNKLNVIINASIIPNKELVAEIKQLEEGVALVKNEKVLAISVGSDQFLLNPFEDAYSKRETKAGFTAIEYPWDIFRFNPTIIHEDFKRLTTGRSSQPIGNKNWVSGDTDLIFIEKGADIKFSYLNTENGPIYIGKNAVVMEGCKIRGPFALCDYATLKMDAKIYEGTTIGPYSKIGGEISNSVIFGFSSKAHDGYLGNSVIGQWCNLGADTNTSNLKNTYENVKAWSYAENSFVDTGTQFCGLMMGDHSKTGINTMLNTGTVVGVFCNIFGEGYQRNFIPSFSWGGTHGFKLYNKNRLLKVAEAVMSRRGMKLDEVDKEMLLYLYDKASIRK